MTNTIDVFWSFRSPYSYLVTPGLLRLRNDFEVDLQFRPVLPIAVRTKESLFTADQRRVKYIIIDAFRRAELLGMPFGRPSPDPIVQDMQTFEVAEEQPYIYRLTGLGIEAARRGKGVEFAYHISHLIWSGEPDWNKGDKLALATAAAGLDLAELDTAIIATNPMPDIEANHAALEAAGGWGVPTMVFNGEPFFGQDRIDTLRWRLEKVGVPRR
ncbi:DsbA family protein [Aquisalinus flavus]|uniref:2-hydroxychromene-2-carboxylate isomerase n=1 Tax=Aquisalinus flavus TaxID=1526572 RepID=A0A8J2V774_9PROT|nr:DsbA family protein [Aquisalinus flavus]MBD0427615.1 DsbA family protein [Aquisalinus flavus]UNE47403.1 2-hydroxychromene-2-carboxylate isomerase [Aquisalinus flavus]GGD02395.1 DSBA oxidoreductase [Aquisalinus flavus]